MLYSLRPWTDRDAGSDIEISQAIYPEYKEDSRHPAWLPARQLGAPRNSSSRYVAGEAQANACVAFATLWEVRPKRFRFDLAVRPERQRQGIGDLLFSQILNDAEVFGATGLQARVRDDNTTAMEFISHRGFRDVQHMGAYRIDFAQAHIADFQESFVRLRDQGFEVTNLAAAREQDSHYLERYCELFSAARESWPNPDPEPSGPTPINLERLKSWMDETPLPEAFFIAKQKDLYVGFSSLFGKGTAAHPNYRGKGIATLLKAGSIADAHHRGFQGQTTGTASPAMRKVLLRLGYKLIWNEVRLIRNLN